MDQRHFPTGADGTIKDGVVFDAQALLREAEWYVQQEKVRMGARGRHCHSVRRGL
jgi:hypothetical protein